VRKWRHGQNVHTKLSTYGSLNGLNNCA